MGNLINLFCINMKFAVCALIATASAVQRGDGFPEHLGEMFPNKSSLWSSDWGKYKKTRQLMVDCDIYESENWLGTGKSSTPGNAEVPEFAKDKDGAMVMMPARKFTSENIHWREKS